MPYGFAEQYQALRWKADDYAGMIRSLLGILMGRFNIPTEFIVRALETSPSYDDAGISVSLLLERTDLTRAHVDRVAKAWLGNRQVREAGSAALGLQTLYDRYKDSIEPSIRRKLERLPEYG